jgi:hypothetical protein
MILNNEIRWGSERVEKKINKREKHSYIYLFY